MQIFEHIFLGILQGVTEFLPVSSSGHLYLAQTFLGWEPSLSLEIFFHAASLAAIILYFWKDIWRILKHTCSTHCLHHPDGVMGLKLLLATILTVPVALLFESQFNIILSVSLVAGTLIITGLIILVAEKCRPNVSRQFTWKIAVLLGLVQGIAVLPGISRAGITIALLILLGLDRKKSAEISFLLAIPTIFGALVFSMKDQSLTIGIGEVIGFVICVLTSFLAIKWMMKLIEKHWIWFAPYCLGLGAVLLFFINK